MKIRERLLECKVKLGIKSDYKLAIALGINRGTLSGYMTGKRQPDAFTSVKIGDILKVHPLLIQAEFEAETAKTPERKAFWINFGQRIKTGAVAMLALISTAIWSPDQRAQATGLDTHNVYCIKPPALCLCRFPSGWKEFPALETIPSFAIFMIFRSPVKVIFEFIPPSIPPLVALA